jgi:hypothetical protein
VENKNRSLENHAAYTAHQDAFDVIPKAQMLQFHKHSFQALFRVFAEMFARRLTSSAVTHTSPKVERSPSFFLFMRTQRGQRETDVVCCDADKACERECGGE